MVLSISTNTASLNVQRNLNEANEASASSLAKLSSGSRVPTAKDDAASLAIGSRVEAEIAGLKQASVNASQATSLLQIADGAYGQVNDILIRQESLAIQSASGQLSDTERAIIDSEFQELSSEVDRIAEDTEFNGNQLLKGGNTIVKTDELATGGLANKGIDISYNADKVADGAAFDVTYDDTTQKLTLTNTGTGEKVEKDVSKMLEAKTGDATTGTDLSAGESLDVEFADLGLTVTLTDDFKRADSFGHDIAQTGTLDLGTTSNFELEGKDFSAIFNSAAFDKDSGMLTLEDTAGDGKLTAAGLTMAVDGVDAAALANDGKLEIKDGATTLISLDLGTVANGAAGDNLTIDLSTVFNNSQTTGATADFSFKVGTGTSASDDIAVSVDSVTSAALGTDASSVGTQTDANSAITAVKGAIDTLQGSRAEIGASLSRLDFASSNISVSIENQSAAKSGLMDVDVAAESTEFASQQVVLQAGVSLLAQANQRPSQLLSLIG